MKSKIEELEAWLEDVCDHPDAMNRLIGASAEAAGEGQRQLLALVDEPRIRIRRAVADGDRVMALVTLRARAPASGQGIEVTGSVHAVVGGDAASTATIGDYEAHWDLVSLFEQLALLPVGTAGRCLAGQGRVGEKEAMVRRAYAAFSDPEPLEDVRSLYHDTFTLMDPGIPDLVDATPEALVQMCRMQQAALPDLAYRVEQVIEGGEWVAARVRICGTHTGEGLGPPSGNRLDIPCFAFARLEDGKVREVHQLVDRLAMFQAMGIEHQQPGG